MRRTSRALAICGLTALVGLLAPLPSSFADDPAPATETLPPIVIMPTAQSVLSGLTPGATPAAASQPNITYHGGPIQKTPKVYVNFWGWPTTLSSTETTYQNKITGFLNALGGTSLKNVDTQYTETSRGAITNPVALYGGLWRDTTAIPAAPTQTDLANAALRTASHFGVSSADAVYLIATPHNHSSSGFITSYCGWHSYTGTTAYINLPYQIDAGNSCNGTSDIYAGGTITAYHEVTEANTDPLVNAWYEGTQNENADKCSWGNGSSQPASEKRWFGSAQYWVQPVWSNRDGQCEFFFLPGHGDVSSSASSATHSASASCSFDHGYLNTGNDGTMSGTTTAPVSQAPLTSTIDCTINLTDSTADFSSSGIGNHNVTGGTATTSGSGQPYGAKNTNSLCVSGSVTYATETLTIPQRCSTL
jgi:hypothetical protein